MRTGLGSFGAAMGELPSCLDTFKSNLQIHGKKGIETVKNKVKLSGPLLSWRLSVATFLGHYPWFFTYNYLSENFLQYGGTLDMIRSMIIGFS